MIHSFDSLEGIDENNRSYLPITYFIQHLNITIISFK